MIWAGVLGDRHPVFPPLGRVLKEASNGPGWHKVEPNAGALPS